MSKSDLIDAASIPLSHRAFLFQWGEGFEMVYILEDKVDERKVMPFLPLSTHAT